MYLGQPSRSLNVLLQFQKKLKDYNRSDQEHFVKWFVAKQDAKSNQLKFSDDQIANAYSEFKGGGEKAENNKRSILRHLVLGGVDGVNKPKDVRETVCVGEHEMKEIWKTYYHFDMPKLFKRFGLVDDDGSVATPAAPVATIDCTADVAAWEMGRAVGNPAFERDDDTAATQSLPTN